MEVLFVCVHNAGRSQAAAALLDDSAQGRVVVRSGGSAPSDSINPFYPGKKYLDWDLPDPAGKALSDVRPIIDAMDRPVGELLHEIGEGN